MATAPTPNIGSSGVVTGGYVNSAGAGYYGSSNLSICPPKSQLMSMAWVNDKVLLKFFGTENGREVEAAYVPERDITAYELSLILQLQQLFIVAAGSYHVSALDYIRANHLERHFKFKAVI